MTKTTDELLQMTDAEIIAYMESGEGFVAVPVDEEMLQRNWNAIQRKLDLKPNKMYDENEEEKLDRASRWINIVMWIAIGVGLIFLALVIRSL